MPEPGMGNKSEASVASGSIGPNSGVSASDVLGGAGRPDRSEPGQRANLASAQYFAEQGITATNPYGKQGFFSKHFGIDPANISYANIMSPNQMANVAALNYDRYANPFAEVNVLGNPTGANPELGVVRSGLKSGDVTALGTVKSVAQPKSPMIKGIASFLPGATTANILNALMPAPTVNMIEGAGMAGTGIPSAFAEQERMGRRTERMGEYSQPSGLGQMVSDMMSFFSPNQQTTNIQPSDVSTGMSAYSETGRPTSGVPQLGPNYGSPMAQITAPATEAPSYGSPMAQVTAPATEAPSYGSPMAQVTAPDPTVNDQLTFSEGEVVPVASSLSTTPQQELTMMLTGARTPQLEYAYNKAADNPELQTVIGKELQARAQMGDPDAISFAPKGVPVPPARPVKFSGSVDQPLNLIPSVLDTLGNPAL